MVTGDYKTHKIVVISKSGILGMFLDGVFKCVLKNVHQDCFILDEHKINN